MKSWVNGRNCQNVQQEGILGIELHARRIYNPPMMRTRERTHGRRTCLIVGLGVCLSLSGCLFPSENRPPILGIQALPQEAYAPSAIVFDASNSVDPEGRTVTIEWDFGDGSTATGATVVHPYQHAGSYQARVVVTDTEGASSSATIPIDIRSIPDGYTRRRFEWERDGDARVWEVLIPYDLYQRYKGRLRVPYVDTYRYGVYVADPLDDPTIEDYATELWDRVGQDDDDFIHEALAFVQGAIRYQADPPGVEHPLYPLETLADGDGDCEDTAILFVSLLQARGIPS
ncbi:PKD domain-containing protein, partial [Candidatus Bipolaricaulota bacterium]|nr:PKD domain-containing protein [Candidatus Bipolaricaulota bacterium]